MNLPEFSTRYPVTIMMATLAVVLLGWISLEGLGTDLLPNLQTPVVTVDLQAPGKSPQEMEERYTRRLEQDISTVSGVRRVYSVTRAGQSVVVAEFAWDTDMDFAVLDVQKRLGTYGSDADVETLDISQEDPQALPVARVAVTSSAGAFGGSGGAGEGAEGGAGRQAAGAATPASGTSSAGATAQAGAGGPAVDVDVLLGSVETLVKPKLEALEGVASAQIEGDAAKEVKVELDPYLLEAFTLTPQTVVQRIQAANQDVSGGTLEDQNQSYQVKGLGRLQDLDDIRDLIVGERQVAVAGGQATATGAAGAAGGNGAGAAGGGAAQAGGAQAGGAGAGGGGQAGAAGGAAGGTGAAGTAAERVPVRIRDIGRVALQWPERQTIVRLDGEEALGLAIYKEADASTVEVVREVTAALEQLSQDLPEIQFTLVENQARFIESAVDEVEEAAIYGAILAVGVLLVFLRNWTVTLLIGIAIPISVLATFTLMYFQGLSLNVMTLGGLALGAGMLVDNAIIVIENIWRHLELGSEPRKAAAEGTSEVGVAILASTLTTVSVFLPIIFLHGMAGELFKEQAWTVAFSLLASLAVAMTTVPMLACRMLRRPELHEAKRPRYRAALEWVLDHKLATGAAIALVLAVTVQLGSTLRAEFIPREDQGLLHLELALPQGSRLELTDSVADRVSGIVRDVGGDEVSAVYSRAGLDPFRAASAGEPAGTNRATISVLLSQERVGTVADLVEDLDEHLTGIPDLEVDYRLHDTALEGIMGARSAPIQLDVVGDDLDTLRSVTAELARGVEELPSVYNVRSSFEGGQPEIDLRLRPEVAAAFGLTPQGLIDTVSRRLSGEIAGELSRDQRSRPIRVGFEQVNLQELSRVRVDTSDGAVLTVGDVAEPRIVEGPREILRQDQRRVGRVSGYLVEGAVLSEAVAEVRGLTSQMALPVGYGVEIVGEERERAESFGTLGFALALSVILVYMVMASLFESLLHPFTVMFTVPLAGVGVVLAFWALGEPLSVMAYIGIIMLGGIAVNDAILLVDRTNQLVGTMPTLREAVLQAAQDRMRPILMTSVTTILALAPMAIGIGEGSELRAPMAIAVIAGLVTATLMTLVVMPVSYEVVQKLRGKAS